MASVSMDGFRKRMSGDAKLLRNRIQNIVETGEVGDTDSLAELMNDVSQHVNINNALYNDHNRDYNELPPEYNLERIPTSEDEK